jgi:hypothetical protein
LRYFNGWHPACLSQARLGRARRQWSPLADQQAEATRFPFPLPGANIGEQKAKVNSFFQPRIFPLCLQLQAEQPHEILGCSKIKLTGRSISVIALLFLLAGVCKLSRRFISRTNL